MIRSDDDDAHGGVDERIDNNGSEVVLYVERR